MGKYLRVFSRIPAFRFRNDRLHCHDDRLRCRELPGSPYMKTVVMAMKTVVRRKNRAPHGKEPSQDLIWDPQKLFEDPFAEGIKAVFKVFFTIRGGLPASIACHTLDLLRLQLFLQPCNSFFG